MMRLVLPRENPRPDRRPGENQRCGERAWAAAQGHGVGGTRASIAPGYTPCTVSGRCPVPGPRGGEGGSMQRIKKSEIITLRVTPRTKETIRERAKAAGLSVLQRIGKRDRASGRAGTDAV